MKQRTRPGTVAVLCAALLLPLAACGPTAEQLQARSASPTPPPPPLRTAAPPQQIPSAAPQETAPPVQVGVAGSQTGMPQAVQDACQWLLRRDAEPMPGPEAGTCLAAAISAGGGAVQSLQTSTSWLPAGQYTIRFATDQGFAMSLRGDNFDIEIREDSRVLRQDAEEITAKPDGSAEEAYAAVLADAAELTVRPERLAALLAAADRVDVEYGVLQAGTAYTRISGSFAAGSDTSGTPGSSAVIPEGSFTIDLDDYYRPVRIGISGLNQGIPSQLTAINSQWGSGPLS